MMADLRDLSKSLFGNRYMLEVCAHFAEEPVDRVSLMSIRGDSDISPSVYSSPLARLVRAQLLRDAGRDAGDHRTRWYEPASVQLWSAAYEIKLMSEAGSE